MKRLITSIALIGSLATASTGCTVAGAVIGGATASHRHETDDDMTTGDGAVIGAMAGLIVDAAILYAMPDCVGPCDQHSGGGLY
jgi:hypothetical protein